MRSSVSPESLQRAVDAASDAVLAVLALVGLALALDGSSWGVAWVLVALLGVVAQLLWTRRQRGVGWSPLGRALAGRATVVVAAAGCLTATRPGSGHALGGALAAAVLVGSLVVEPFVARAARLRVPAAIRLPGVPVRRTLPDLGPLAVAAGSVAVAVGLLLAVVGWSSWWWLLVALLAVSPVAVLAFDGRAKILLSRRLRTLIPRAVAAYAPEFVLYTSRPDDASYQVQMWLPYLKRSGLRFIVVTRNNVPAMALAGLTDVPVVEARGMSELDALVGPSLKAAFYVNASSGNGALVRFQHLTHIYLGHGDSDKPPSYNPTHAMYDVIFAAGQAATRRYAAHGVRIPAEKFRVVGRPQVEDVRPPTVPISRRTDPVVLYAPTWRGHVEETMLYSLPRGEEIVATLLRRGATVIFRPHPFSYDFSEDADTIAAIGQLLAADARRTGRPHLWGAAAESERGILDCMNASDAMVTDVSSVVSDYLFSAKPFAMIAVPSEPEAFVTEFPVARASYVVRGDLADLEPRLAEMLGPDPLAETRAQIRVDYLGDFPAQDYASGFVDAVRDVTHTSVRIDSDDQSDDAERSGEEPDRNDADPGAEEDDGKSIAVRVGANLSRYGRIAVRVLLDLAGTGLALLALASALAAGPIWLTTVLAALAIWATFQSVSTDVVSRLRWSRLLTEGDATRAVLVGAFVVSAAGPTGIGWADAVTGAALLAGIAVERRIRAAWGTGQLVRNLPEALREIRELLPRGLLPLISSLVILVGLVQVWAGGPPAVTLVPALVYLVLVVEVTVRALSRAAEVERAELRLPAAVASYAPQFAVYFASTVGAHYQVGMWLPYFVRIGRPFIIVTRTAPMLRQIERLCQEMGVSVPIIYRRTLRGVEDVIVDSMTSAFYVNNAPRNTHFVERRELTHIWLNHGDSEKPACFNPVHAIYDLIFAAGQAGIDRYARHGVTIPPEKFAIVGRPQVERITSARGPISTIESPTVLYAPTWQGPYADSRVYSLPAGRQIVEQLLAHGARVIFRAHPFNYRYLEAREMITQISAVLEADRTVTGREHVWGEAAEQAMTIEDCFNASDAMVSDVSAVVSDYLHSGKPFAMVSVGRSPEQLVVDAPAAQAAYVIRDDLSNLSQVCDDLLGPDPLGSARLATKVYYLGDFSDERYADGFLDAARRVIDGGRHTDAVRVASA